MELPAKLNQVPAVSVRNAVDEMVGVLENNLILDKLTRAGSRKVTNVNYWEAALGRRSIDAGDKTELFGVIGLAQILRALAVIILQVVAVISEPGFVHPTGIGDIDP